MGAKERLKGALGDAARKLAARLERDGVTGEVWGAVQSALGDVTLGGGVRYQLGWCYDRDLGDNGAREYLGELLGRGAKRAHNIASFRRDYSGIIGRYVRYQLPGNDQQFSVMGMTFGHSLGFTMVAWRRMVEHNLWDEETNRQLGEAERALARSEREIAAAYRELPTMAIASPFLMSWSADVPTSEYLALNSAYLNYVRGIYWEKLAAGTNDEAARERLMAKSRDAFKSWRSALEGLGDWKMDAFMMRAVAIAEHNGSRGYGRDRESALRRFQEADSAGSVDAKNWVGVYPDIHLGLRNDPVAAVKKFREAAEFGSSVATWNLAMSYLFGAGVAQDLTQSLALFEKAEKRGLSYSFLKTHVFQPTEHSWRATSPDGDELVVSIEGGQRFPLRLKINPDGKKREGRVLAYSVRYELASVGAAHIELQPPSPTTPFFHGPERSARELVQESGETTVWVSSPEPRVYVDPMIVELRDAATDKVVLQVTVPAIARWDR